MNAADLSRILVVLRTSKDNLGYNDGGGLAIENEIDEVSEIIRKELEAMPVKVTRTLRRKRT